MNNWQNIKHCISVAHAFHGMYINKIRTIPVHLSDELHLNESNEEHIKKGVIELYLEKISKFGKTTYSISTEETKRSEGANVYWLPWSEHKTTLVDSIPKEAKYFLTSPLSGCSFVTCGGGVMHIPAAKSINERNNDIESFRGTFIDKAQSKIALPEDLNNESQWESYDNEVSKLKKPDVSTLTSSSSNNFENSTYGKGNLPPRAIVMGVRKSGGFLYAYQDLTGVTENATWTRL